MASGPKQPKPVDPELAAAAQARWNRTGQQTPFGSVEWDGNNQVVKPSDAMMAMFGQAQGIATGGADRYQAPDNFGSIRDQVMARLGANNYGANGASKPTKGPMALSGPPQDDDDSLAKGTPWRDAFLGAEKPDGSRHTVRHMLTGGLQGAIPRGLMNMYRERQQPISMDPMPVRGLDEMNARRDSGNPGPMALSAPGTSPTQSTPTTLTPDAIQAIAAMFPQQQGGLNQRQQNQGLIDENMLRTQAAMAAANGGGGQGLNANQSGQLMVNNMRGQSAAARNAVDQWRARNIQ